MCVCLQPPPAAAAAASEEKNERERERKKEAKKYCSCKSISDLSPSHFTCTQEHSYSWVFLLFLQSVSLCFHWKWCKNQARGRKKMGRSKKASWIRWKAVERKKQKKSTFETSLDGQMTRKVEEKDIFSRSHFLCGLFCHLIHWYKVWSDRLSAPVLLALPMISCLFSINSLRMSLWWEKSKAHQVSQIESWESK